MKVAFDSPFWTAEARVDPNRDLNYKGTQEITRRYRKLGGSTDVTRIEVCICDER